MKGLAVRFIMLLLAITAGTVVGTFTAYNSHENASLKKPYIADLNQEKQAQTEEEAVSVLICGIDDTMQLTDVLLYAVLDPETKKVNVLQIPRDSFVGEEYPTGKINAVTAHPVVYDDGMQELKMVLYQQLGLPVDYYVTLKLSDFRRIVDTMGGVKMNVPKTINYLYGKTIWQGEQYLSGEQAEWLVRYRSGYAQGDIGRMSMQAEFLKAAAETIKAQGIVNAIKVLNACYSEVNTDMPFAKMLSYATECFELDIKDISFHTVPGTGKMNRSYAVYQIDAAALKQLLDSCFISKDTADVNIRQVPEQPKFEDNAENDIWQEFLNSLPEQDEQTERSEQTEPIDIEPFWDEQFTQPELKEGNK
ncbi:MAG: LCP family protein [Oscillospiraceae bacterium]|nr:LCP family protein [Oscillospiraceae bacterium]